MHAYSAMLITTCETQGETNKTLKIIVNFNVASTKIIIWTSSFWKYFHYILDIFKLRNQFIVLLGMVQRTQLRLKLKTSNIGRNETYSDKLEIYQFSIWAWSRKLIYVKDNWEIRFARSILHWMKKYSLLCWVHA